MKKALHIAASPNTEIDDVRIAWRRIIKPWSWYKGDSHNKLQNEISQYFNTENVCMYDSGRSAIMEALKALGVGPGDEVLVHAFTCLVVVNPIIWVGAKPVFVDVNPDNYNFDLEDLKKKKTDKTKAVIVQHTFGIPEKIHELRKIVGPSVYVIEDLAHSLGAEYKGKKLGDYGDAAILTFGIEKVISSVRGGAAIIYNDKQGKILTDNYNKLPKFPRSYTFVSLFNPIFWFLVSPVYYLGIGKFTLGRIKVWFAHKLNILGRMIEDEEYKGSRPKWLPTKISPALADIGLNQWGKLAKFNNHREEIKKIYEEELGVKFENTQMMLRFPVKVNNRADLIKKAGKKGWVFGDWYKKILYSPAENLSFFGYESGLCPKAEELKNKVVNLPTFIKVSRDDAFRIAKMVKPFVG